MAMKSTRIVRRVDDLGRVVIPKEIRRIYRLKEGDSIEFFVSEHSEIILKKYSYLNDEKEMLRIAQTTVAQELSIRQVEKMVKYALQGEKPKPKKRDKKRDQYYDEVEIALTNTLGRKVKVYLSPSGNRGTLEFEFFGKEDLTKLAKEFDK